MQLKQLCLMLLLGCASLFGQDVMMFRGNPSHTGVYQAAGVPKLTGVKWKFHTGGMVIGSPTIAGGVLYAGSTDGNLYAIDAESGTERWKFGVKSRLTSTAAIAGGIVYFAAYDGNFYAVDAATGALKWKFQTGGERRFAGKHLHGTQPVAETMPDPFDCYLSSPVVWKGAVYFGSGDGNIYSLDAVSGSLKWKFKTGDVVHASPAIADDTVYIGSWDSYFYALDASTGKEKWRFKTGEDHDIYNQVGIQSSAGWWMAWCISAVAIRICTRSMRLLERRGGLFPRMGPGWWDLPRCWRGRYIFRLRIQVRCTRSMRNRGRFCAR